VLLKLAVKYWQKLLLRKLLFLKMHWAKLIKQRGAQRTGQIFGLQRALFTNTRASTHTPVLPE
jgi:hypothetical protein